jgi:hypothetical protein
MDLILVHISVRYTNIYALRAKSHTSMQIEAIHSFFIRSFDNPVAGSMFVIVCGHMYVCLMPRSPVQLILLYLSDGIITCLEPKPMRTLWSSWSSSSLHTFSFTTNWEKNQFRLHGPSKVDVPPYQPASV